MTTTEKQDGDTDGPFHVGAVAEGAGKLFWVTSDSLLDSTGLTVTQGESSMSFCEGK